MAPPVLPPEVAIILTLDRYLLPSALGLVGPMIQRIKHVYPDSVIRLASITYGATCTDELILKSFYFEDQEPVFQRIRTELGTELGLRGRSAGRGKGALLEALVAALEFFDLHAASPFVPTPPPPEPGVNHFKLRSYKPYSNPSHSVNPVRFIIALSFLPPDTGTRALRNRSSEFDGCTWGRLEGKMKERGVHLTSVSMQNSPKLATLYSAVNVTPPDVLWFNIPPPYNNAHILLSGFQSSVTRPSNKRPAPSAAPTASEIASPPAPYNSAPNNGNHSVAGAGTLQTTMQLPNTTIQQDTNRARDRRQMNLPGALMAQSGNPAMAPPGSVGNISNAPKLRQPLPQPQMQPQDQMLLPQSHLQPLGPGIPAMNPAGLSHADHINRLMAMKEQQRPSSTLNVPNPATGPPRPNSVAAGSVHHPLAGQLGGHSRSTSLQGPPLGGMPGNGGAMLPPGQMQNPMGQMAQPFTPPQAGHARMLSNSSPFMPQMPNAGGMQASPMQPGLAAALPITPNPPQMMPNGPQMQPLTQAALAQFQSTGGQQLPPSIDQLRNLLNQRVQEYTLKLPVQLQQQIQQAYLARSQNSSEPYTQRLRTHLLCAVFKTYYSKSDDPHSQWKVYAETLLKIQAMLDRALGYNADPNAGMPVQQMSQLPPPPSQQQQQQAQLSSQAGQEHHEAKSRFMEQQQQKIQNDMREVVVQRRHQQQSQTPMPPVAIVPSGMMQIPGMNPNPGAGNGSGMPQVLPNISRPPTTQPQLQLQQNSIGHQVSLPQPPGVGAQIPGQAGAPIVKTEGPRPTKVREGQLLSWIHPDAKRESLVFIEIFTVSPGNLVIPDIINMTRGWPSTLAVHDWQPKNPHELHILLLSQKWTIFELMPSTPPIGAKLRAEDNQAKWKEFFNLLAVKVGSIKIPMNGRNDTGLLVFTPPAKKPVAKILALLYSDGPIARFNQPFENGNMAQGGQAQAASGMANMNMARMQQQQLGIGRPPQSQVELGIQRQMQMSQAAAQQQAQQQQQMNQSNMPRLPPGMTQQQYQQALQQMRVNAAAAAMAQQGAGNMNMNMDMNGGGGTGMGQGMGNVGQGMFGQSMGGQSMGGQSMAGLGLGGFNSLPPPPFGQQQQQQALQQQQFQQLQQQQLAQQGMQQQNVNMMQTPMMQQQGPGGANMPLNFSLLQQYIRNNKEGGM